MFPPSSMPLKILGQITERFTVKPLEGGMFELTAQRGSYGVGYGPEDVVYVKPMQGGNKPEYWSVEPANDQGCYRIKLPDKDKYWTNYVDDLPQLRLEAANGSPNQEWRFVRVDE
ncbi:unnamed protein product [Rhizoctonia solani]|uniref:Uncharacterized protein n=1 Tax=Rhizoctonia solani TaxID=456999 RepID=A0A8H3D7P4_9AGAM|nr:unnamed protein product [Rhizoctonia solani]